MALIQCPECGQNISDKAKTCVHCGVGVGICSECGSAYIEGVEICPSCGYAFGKAEESKKDNSLAKDIENTEEDIKIFKEISGLVAKWKKRYYIIIGVILALYLVFIIPLFFGVRGNITEGVILGISAKMIVSVFFLAIMEYVKEIADWIQLNIAKREIRAIGRNKYMRCLNTYDKYMSCLDTYEQMKNAQVDMRQKPGMILAVAAVVWELENPSALKRRTWHRILSLVGQSIIDIFSICLLFIFALPLLVSLLLARAEGIETSTLLLIFGLILPLIPGVIWGIIKNCLGKFMFASKPREAWILQFGKSSSLMRFRAYTWDEIIGRA